MYIKWKLETFWMQIWHKKYNFFWKIWKKLNFQKKFSQFRWDFFIRNTNFSKIFINNPQNLYYPLVLNTQNENYMKVWYPQLRPRQHGKPSKSLRAHSTPPILFRVNIAVDIFRIVTEPERDVITLGHGYGYESLKRGYEMLPKLISVFKIKWSDREDRTKSLF